MIQRQTYKEFIQEQGQIESTLAEGWGYALNPNQHVPINKKPEQHIKVTSIQPMKRILNIPPSKQLLKIQEQLLMMQNEKRLNELTQQAKAAFQRGEVTENHQSAAIQMMRQCIDQYNFLLEHRHIIEKNSERARKLLGIKKSRIEVLNQQIAALKQQLTHSTIAKMVTINKKIAQLYREYEKNMFSSKQTSLNYPSRKGTSLDRSKHMTSGFANSINIFSTNRLSPGPKTEKRSSKASSSAPKSKRKSQKIELKDFVIMQKMKESQSGDSIALLESVNWIEGQLKQPQSVFIQKPNLNLQKKRSENYNRNRLYTVTQKKSVREEKKDRMNTTITESFLSKEVMDKGKDLDSYIRQYEDVLEVWRNRIDENKQKNSTNFLRLLPKAKRFKKSLANIQSPACTAEEDLSKQKINKARSNIAHRMEEVKQSMAEKEKIFSIILRKKQSKFKKIPGTQIIKRNNPDQEAKVYLGTYGGKTGEKRTRNTVYGTTLHQDQKRKTQSDVPEWLNIEADSQQLYQSRCRNEKLNLLLKSNKKQ